MLKTILNTLFCAVFFVLLMIVSSWGFKHIPFAIMLVLLIISVFLMKYALVLKQKEDHKHG